MVRTQNGRIKLPRCRYPAACMLHQSRLAPLCIMHMCTSTWESWLVAHAQAQHPHIWITHTHTHTHAHTHTEGEAVGTVSGLVMNGSSERMRVKHAQRRGKCSLHAAEGSGTTRKVRINCTGQPKPSSLKVRLCTWPSGRMTLREPSANLISFRPSVKCRSTWPFGKW